MDIKTVEKECNVMITWSHYLIGLYHFWLTCPRNLTSFTRPFLARRCVWVWHETSLQVGSSYLAAILLTPRQSLALCLLAWQVAQMYPGNKQTLLFQKTQILFAVSSLISHLGAGLFQLWPSKIGGLVVLLEKHWWWKFASIRFPKAANRLNWTLTIWFQLWKCSLIDVIDDLNVKTVICNKQI